MATQLNKVVEQLRRTGLLHDADPPTDGQLLERFVSRRDTVALETLVRRHAPMVWGVCRRVLPNHHDAEDAFQATFLVLLRKAASVIPREMVGNWLYGVAHQTALKARATGTRQRARERQVVAMPEPAVNDQDPARDLHAVLDLELSRMPDKYRVAIVLCDLEGKTRKEAAQQLGLPEGTVAGRLTRGRTILAKRLARHGLAVSGSTVAGLLAQQAASASVPAAAMTATINVISLVAAGQAAAGLVSARIATLTEGVVRGMLLKKLLIAIAIAIVLAVTVTLAGASRLYVQDGDPLPAEPVQPAAPQAAQPPQPPQPAKEVDPDDPKFAGHFNGRVTGPDGKPLSGARVYIVPALGATRKDAGPIRARTDADGRFAFEAPDMTYADQDGLPARREGFVIVTADGYAPDWFHTWGKDHGSFREYWDPVKGDPVELQLVKNDVPIHGRFLDSAGRPLAGARVQLTALRIPPKHDLSAFLDRWSKASVYSGFLTAVPNYEREIYRPEWIPGLTTETRTDADGRFKMSGLGHDRLARLTVSAPSVVDTTLEVMTRDGPEVRILFIDGGQDAGTVIHGAGFTLKLERGRTIKGRVIDRSTRAPIAGMRVGTRIYRRYDYPASDYPWVTDAKGRFTITGLAPTTGKQLVVAVAAPGMPYQSAGVEVTGDAEAVIECRHGIPFRLKLTDKQGKPALADVTWVDVQPNPNVTADEKTHWPLSLAARRADGTYEGFVLPGPGAVLVKTANRSAYRPGFVDPQAFFAPGRAKGTKEEKGVYGTKFTLATYLGRYVGDAAGDSSIYQDDFEAIVLVNPPSDSGPLQLSATVVRDRPRLVSLIDPDGKPVLGAEMVYPNGYGPRLRAASFPLTRLHPDRVYRRTFMQEDRRLIGYLEARGDGDAPYTVHMQPWAAITGRIVDANGQPMREATLSLVGGRSWPKTDAKGRFRFDKLIPGKRYSAEVYRDRFPGALTGMAFENLDLRPGEVRDLGAIRIKPAAK